MIIPKKLKLGDTIGIVSPSGSITEEKKDGFLRGVKVLEKTGFRVKLGENIYGDWHHWGISAGTPEQKANDINKMFIDNEVKAVLCSRGGETANSILNLLDYRVIKQNPKIFCGFSDNSALINAIYNKTGLVTFYGPDVRGHFGGEAVAYTKAEFLSRFVEGNIGEIRKNSAWEEIRRGKAAGRMVGGNLSTLEYLIGTKYFPKTKKALLFIEGYEGKPGKVASILYHFKELGIWDRVRGVVVGYVYGQEKQGGYRPFTEEILLAITGKYDFPIMKVRDFGHRTECTPLPVGVRAKIDTKKLGFKILEKCVK